MEIYLYFSYMPSWCGRGQIYLVTFTVYINLTPWQLSCRSVTSTRWHCVTDPLLYNVSYDSDNLKSRGNNNCLVMLVAFMVYHPRNLTSRHDTWWLKVGNLLLWDFTYAPSFTTEQNECGVGRFLYHAPQKLPVHIIQACFTIRVVEFMNHTPYMDAATIVSLACSAV
jgi:hypothetical protein